MDHEEFRTWRRSRYRTQAEAGKVFGVNRMTVNRWELGKRWPPGNLLELACKAVDVAKQETEAA